MNNYKKLSELVQEVIKNLSMYQGTATQLYAEDRIAAMIIRLFNKIIDSRYWKTNVKWFKYNLIGIDGVCSEKVSDDIGNFYDILAINSEINPQYTLKQLHHSTNPYLVEGTTPNYYIPSNNPDKIFAVVPFNATGVIYVLARQKPKQIDVETVIPFDPDVLILGACYEYCADDGNSTMQVQKFQTMYQERLKQLENLDNAGTYDYNDEEAYYNTRAWR